VSATAVKPDGGPLGRMLLAKTFGNAGLNAATMLFNLVIVLILTNRLGATRYGAFAFACAFALLLVVPAVLGLPPLVTREIAAYRVRESWGAIRGVIRRTNQAVVGASTVVVAVTLIVFVATGWPHEPLRRPTMIALVLVPLVALTSLRQSAMQGFGRVVLGRTPEGLVAPALTIVLILALALELGHRFSAAWAVGAVVAAGSIAFALGAALFRRTAPSAVRRSRPEYATRAWAFATLPLVLMSGISAVNDQVGVVLVGALGGARHAGIFSVASRAAALIPFFLLAAVPTLMPSIAELHTRGESERLQRLMTHAARLVFFGSLPIVLAVIVFARPLLHVFGSDFGGGVTPLWILALGQVVNVSTGLPGTILIMIGDSSRVTRSVAVGAVTNVALGIALIPSFGATGAAIAGASSIALTNLMLATVLWKSRRISSLPIALAPR
jgi:O-antigen/teichoic acid export membrane protein